MGFIFRKISIVQNLIFKRNEIVTNFISQTNDAMTYLTIMGSPIPSRSWFNPLTRTTDISRALYNILFTFYGQVFIRSRVQVCASYGLQGQFICFALGIMTILDASLTIR